MSGVVSSAFVELLLKTGELLQLDRGELMATARLAGTTLSDPDGGVRTRTLDRLWTAIDARPSPSRFAEQAARVAAQTGPSCLGVAGLILSTARNLHEMAPLNERYRPLIGPFTPSLRIRPNRTLVVFPMLTSPVARLRSWNDAEALSAVTLMRAFTGVPWRPLEVQLRHDGRCDRAYQEWFDCRIRFRCATTTVVFPRALADQPFVSAPPGFANYLVKHGERLLAQIDTRRPFLERVLERLPRALSTRRNVAATVAEELGVGERTLQRYLRSEGSSFGDALAQARRRLADQYLGDGDRTVAEIAELLGYSDARAFSRAFRRWTGTTPAAQRNQPPKA
jgi:AraC-like DNA-binding protein